MNFIPSELIIQDKIIVKYLKQGLFWIFVASPEGWYADKYHLTIEHGPLDWHITRTFIRTRCANESDGMTEAEKVFHNKLEKSFLITKEEFKAYVEKKEAGLDYEKKFSWKVDKEYFDLKNVRSRCDRNKINSRVWYEVKKYKKTIRN